MSALHAVLLLLFIALVEWLFGWQVLLSAWQKLSLPDLLAAIVLMVMTYQLRALRLYDYFALGKLSDDVKGKWINALLTFRLMLLHNVLNNLLPARTGEVSFPLLMKRYFAVPYHRSLPALFWFRLLDLHTILSIALLPLMTVFLPLLLSVGLFGVWMAIPFIVYVAQNRWQRSLAAQTSEQNPSKLYNFLLKLLEGLPNSAGAFWRSWFLTLLNWWLKLWVLAWILIQLSQVDIHWGLAVEAVIGGELTSILPFHAPGGVGTYEAGIVAVLSSTSHWLPQMGEITLKSATALAVNVHLFVLAASMIGGIVAWLIPVKPAAENGGADQ